MNDDTMYLPRDSWSKEDLEFWDKMAVQFGQQQQTTLVFDMITIGCFHINPEYAVKDMLVWFSDVDNKVPVTARLKMPFAQKLLNQLYEKLGLHQKKLLKDPTE